LGEVLSDYSHGSRVGEVLSVRGMGPRQGMACAIQQEISKDWKDWTPLWIEENTTIWLVYCVQVVQSNRLSRVVETMHEGQRSIRLNSYNSNVTHGVSGHPGFPATRLGIAHATKCAPHQHPHPHKNSRRAMLWQGFGWRSSWRV
jgi:hypothetical protein